MCVETVVKKKKKSCIISLIRDTQSSQTQKQNGDCGGLEGGEWGVSCTMGEVSILQDEKVQEIFTAVFSIYNTAELENG